MDLTTWMAADHANLRQRWRSGVAEQVPAELWPQLADGGGSSIAGLAFHMAVHHDIAINCAVRGTAPLLAQWRDALGLTGAEAWAGLPEREDRDVTAALDLVALAQYADAVHDSTATWLGGVGADALDVVPDAGVRLESLAGVPAAELGWLHGMWTGRSVGWFVQWEVIGHGYTHVGEAVSIRNRFGLSPF